MQRAGVINVAGKEIVSINFARGKDADIAKAIAEATPLIRRRPEGSVLTLTDATEIGISRLGNERVVAFVKGNRPYGGGNLRRQRAGNGHPDNDPRSDRSRVGRFR
jgi:hypothetical protein